jgi:predicted AAA+ superfamily ATPase
VANGKYLFLWGTKVRQYRPSGKALPTGGNGFALSAVGVEPLARHLTQNHLHPQIHYWNNGQKEVDYVLHGRESLQALEVKSGHNMGNVSGLAAFAQQFAQAQPLVIGTGGMPLALWLSGPTS